MNCYAVLGVKKNASPKAIQRAFRRLARQHHPDCQGDAKKFEEIHQAYKTLSDPAARKKYDETGEVWTGAPDNSVKRGMEYLVAIICEVIHQIIMQGGTTKTEDVIFHAKSLLTKQIPEFKKQVTHYTKMVESLQDVSERAITDGPDNIVAGIATAQINVVKGEQAKMTARIAMAELSLELLKSYRYRVDKPASYNPRGGSFLDQLVAMQRQVQTNTKTVQVRSNVNG